MSASLVAAALRIYHAEIVVKLAQAHVMGTGGPSSWFNLRQAVQGYLSLYPQVVPPVLDLLAPGKGSSQRRDLLVERLRGRYPIGPLSIDGIPEFGWRMFGASTISIEAAGEIERLSGVAILAGEDFIEAQPFLIERLRNERCAGYPLVPVPILLEAAAELERLQAVSPAAKAQP